MYNVHSPSELPNCSEAAGAQREWVQGRAEGDLHVRVELDCPRLREEDTGGGAQAVPAGQCFSHPANTKRHTHQMIWKMMI